MGNDQDLKALMSSEVFRNYLAIETEREAKAHLPTEEQIKTAKRKAKEEFEIIQAFAQFECDVKENAMLKQAFLDVQKQINDNPALAKKLNKKFVNAIMMLDLQDSISEE